MFGIDVNACIHCGGAVRIAEEPHAILAILHHFDKHGALTPAHYRPRPRGPPAWPWPRDRRVSHDAEAQSLNIIRCGHDPALLRSTRCRQSAEKSSRTALPNTHQSAETLCDDATTTDKPSQTDACAAAGYNAD